MVMCWEREGYEHSTVIKLTLEGQQTQISSLIYSRFFSSNTTFFTPLTRVRPPSRLALLQVDRNVEKVDQDKGDSRPK